MLTAFTRRIYNIQTFTASIDDAVSHLGEFKAAVRADRVSKAFAERIMLAVTQVNGCRYCDWGHTYVALSAGVSPHEIDALRRGALTDLPPEEIPALLFARHVAQTEGHPDPAAWEQLIAVYDADTARDIMAYVRMIMIGNLSGNTFDAFFSRLIGRPAPGSTLWQELGVLLGAPFILVRALLRRR